MGQSDRWGGRGADCSPLDPTYQEERETVGEGGRQNSREVGGAVRGKAVGRRGSEGRLSGIRPASVASRRSSRRLGEQ